MDTLKGAPRVRRKFVKRLLWIIGILLVIISGISVYLYSNFNRLLSQALMNSFNSGAISNVYELKFDKLNVNLVLGNIQVHNVALKPRKEPIRMYSYINSSMDLHAKKILLSGVEIFTLLNTNILKLKKVEVMEPDIDIKLSGRRNILFPFRDTVNTQDSSDILKKDFIEALLLKEFAIVNAIVHINNESRKRELNIKNLSISLKDLMFQQPPGMDLLTNKQVDLSIGEITWRLKNAGVQSIRVSEYKLKIDSFFMQNSADTMLYSFKNFTTGLKVLNMQTEDSLFNLTMDSFNVSYRDSSIILKGIKFDPNISDAALQRKYTYQTSIFSGTVNSIKLQGLNFDSLIFANKIFLDDVVMDKLSVSIFRDQTKPVNKKHFPNYPGQQLRSIEMPFLIRRLKATNINLVNTERIDSGRIGKINIKRMTIDAKNITNLSTNGKLTVNANAFLENKAHTFLTLGFQYDKPQFSIDAEIRPFNMPDLNAFFSSYTPASIHKGVADGVTISGMAYRNYSSGKMKFLYHDLDMDLALKDHAKWVNSLLSFVGNTITESSNPPSANKPAKIVQFRPDRDMNKGFINILIKSVLAGSKETLFMSKENRKRYKEAKKNARNETKAGK